jgi:hypothetical protein
MAPASASAPAGPSERASEEEASNLALAVQLSEALAQNEREADEELDRALQISLEDVELQRTIAASRTASDESASPSQHVSSSTTRQASEQLLTLKVRLDGDTRRARVAWATGACPARVLGEIRSAVQRVFGTSLEGADFVLKYFDADGDACTLVEATLDDGISFARDGALRLLVEVSPARSLAPALEPNTERVGGARGAFQLVTQDGAGVHEISIATPSGTPRESESSCALEYGESLDWTAVEESETESLIFA